MFSVWLALLCVTSVLCVNYQDLQGMGVSCSPRDTCRRVTSDFRDTNCECDPSCFSYNDCCVDGPKPPGRHRRPQRLQGLTCIPFLSDQGVYGISKCGDTWDGPTDVIRKCEDSDDLSDPVMSVPVTHAEKKLTYRNLHCAACNSASSSSLTFWNLKILCNSLSEKETGYKNITEQFIMENMVRVDNSWGVYHWNKRTGSTSFFPCELGFAIPRSVTNNVRYCRPNVVSSCDAVWNRDNVRKDCDSYMGVVYINGKGYRNAHCALCNQVSLQNVKCSPPGDSDIELTWLSLSALVDINEKRNICSRDEKYDPVFKKCRRVFCNNPGHVVKNGECVGN